MLLFIGVQAQAWARGLSIECDCFGSLSRQRVGGRSILRDVALALPGLVLLFLAGTPRVARPPLARAV
jgi:hypothetical protein